MDRVSRLMRVIPSAATCVSGLVGFMTVAAHSKSGKTRIYTKFLPAPSRARSSNRRFEGADLNDEMEPHLPPSDSCTSRAVRTSENLQVCNCLTGLYSANSRLAGANVDPPWQTPRALRNSL